MPKFTDPTPTAAERQELRFLQQLEHSPDRKLLIFLQRRIYFMEQLLHFVLGLAVGAIFWKLQFGRNLPTWLLLPDATLVHFGWWVLGLTLIQAIIVTWLLRALPWEWSLIRWYAHRTCRKVFADPALVSYCENKIFTNRIRSKTPVQRLLGGAAMERVITPGVYVFIGSFLIYLCFLTFGMI